MSGGMSEFIVPEGWRLVPVEATQKMVDAFKSRAAVTNRGGLLNCGHALNAAIAAAPAPAPSTGVYSADPLACPGCVNGCFRCAPDHGATHDGIVIPRPLADRIFEIIAGEGSHEEGELADIIDATPTPEPDHKEMVSVPRKLLIWHLDEIGRYAWPENTDEQLRAFLAGGDQ